MTDEGRLGEAGPDRSGGGSQDDAWMKRCPACGQDCYHEGPCEHFVTDWCFTCDTPSGRWAGDERVLMEFAEVADAFKDAVEELDVDVRGDRLTHMLPPHVHALAVESAERGAMALEHVLTAAIPLAAGYLGTGECETDGMCSDAWTVYWAKDGTAAALGIEPTVRERTAVLREATRRLRMGL